MTLPSEKSDTDIFLELKDISLNYGSLNVLKKVNLLLNHSQIHAVVGEHGAGKTSLCRVLCGLVHPDEGSILIDGEPKSSFSLQASRNLGIEYVSQHNPLFDNFSVADNLFATAPPSPKKLFYDQQEVYEKALAFLQDLKIDIDPYAKVKRLKLSDRVLVDILKHMTRNVRLLILDEALQKLPSIEQKKILDKLKALKQSGMAILFVTHRIDELYNFADSVSIIKNGELIISDSILNIDKINLIKLAYTQIGDTNLTHVTQDYYKLLKYNAAVLQELPVNLIVIDPEKNIMLMNSHAQEYFSISQDSAIGRPLQAIFAQNRRAYEITAYGIAGQGHETFYHIPLKVEGSDRVVNVRINPIKDVNFIIGYSVFIEDVTEEESLRQQIILSENLSSIGLLSAGVAHEINNPLEILSYSLHYLKNRHSEGETWDILRDMEEEISAISDIVGNLIAFSEKNRTDDERVVIDDVFSGIIRLLKFNAKLNKIQIHFVPGKDKIITRINRTELRQVILNLLKNSFEAMPNGGVVTIETGKTNDEDGGAAFFTIRDNGVGVPNEDVHEVFVPFYTSKKENGKSQGLGLSVSYGIIRKYGGTIRLRNLEEGGCEVVVTLPES